MPTDMENTRVAMADLLKVPVVPDATAYPETLVLPEAVHDGIIRAVDKTMRNDREYSVSFYYEDDFWEAGRLFRGYRRMASLTHTIIGISAPPELSLHTHPLVRGLPLTQGLGERLIGVKRTDREARKQSHSEVMPKAMRLFSVQDLRGSEVSSAGTLGEAVASPYGIVLLLKNQLDSLNVTSIGDFIERVLDPENKPKRRRAFSEYAEYSKTMDPIRHGSYAKFDEKTALEGLCNAVRQRYTVYHNKDFRSPELVIARPTIKIYDQDFEPIR